MHEKYDIVLAPSAASAGYMSKAMKTDIDKFRIIILPHLENLIEKTQRSTTDITPGERKTILYAPTFRRGKNNPVDELASYIDSSSYDLIFKPHPSDETQIIAENVIVSHENIYDLISRSDIIISDYSSILVEAAVLGKQTFVFAYDIDIYRKDPGLNIDFETEGLSDIMFYNANVFWTMNMTTDLLEDSPKSMSTQLRTGDPSLRIF